MKQDNNSIDIAEILRDKPQGTRLYSTVHGYLTLDKVVPQGIICRQQEMTKRDDVFIFKPNGHLNNLGQWYDHGECVLFPSKELRRWDVFTWRNGDVLESEDGRWIAVFNKFERAWGDDPEFRFLTHFSIKYPHDPKPNFRGSYMFFAAHRFTIRHDEAFRQEIFRRIDRSNGRPFNRYDYSLFPVVCRGIYIMVEYTFKDGSSPKRLLAIADDDYNMMHNRLRCHVFASGDGKTVSLEPDFIYLYPNDRNVANISLRYAKVDECRLIDDALREKGFRWDDDADELRPINELL